MLTAEYYRLVALGNPSIPKLLKKSFMLGHYVQKERTHVFSRSQTRRFGNGLYWKRVQIWAWTWLKSCKNSTSLSQLSLRDLVQRRPSQVIELILAPEETVPNAQQLESSTLKRLPVQQLLSLQKRYKDAVVQNDFPSLTVEQ